VSEIQVLEIRCWQFGCRRSRCRNQAGNQRGLALAGPRFLSLERRYSVIIGPTMTIRLGGLRRGVAQPGRAPGSGPGGRRFKSSLPDHLFSSRYTPCKSLKIPPAPKRKQSTSWKDFIRAHMGCHGGNGFLHVEVLTLRGLKNILCLVLPSSREPTDMLSGCHASSRRAVDGTNGTQCHDGGNGVSDQLPISAP
jgi:hypothetical protein